MREPIPCKAEQICSRSVSVIPSVDVSAELQVTRDDVFAWLWLVVGADLLLEKKLLLTDWWLVTDANLVRRKSITDWPGERPRLFLSQRVR